MTPTLYTKITRAIKLIRAAAPADGSPIEVAYSGGKDSDVILQLTKEAGVPYRAIYKCTSIDPPGTVAHAKAMGAEILKPKKTFRELVIVAGLPTRFYRFCCKQLKEYKVLDKAIVGVRRAESTPRSQRYSEPTQCRFYGSKKEHVEQIFPILDWTDADVEAFILDRHIQCAPIYYDADGTFHVERRLGCMCCPMKSKKKRIADFEAHPGMVVFYIHALEKYWQSHPDSSACKSHSTPYEHFVHDVFFPRKSEWEQHKNGIQFEPIDYKAFLEDRFHINL